MSQPRRYLFVCGCARSGTSLVTDLLVKDPSIAIGMERYQQLVTTRPEAFTPALFETERFFSLQPGDTFYPDLMAVQHFVRIREVYDSASYVGDKVPRLTEHYPLLAERFEGAKIVFVSRGLPGVAASFKARATDPDDRLWPRERGVAAAVQLWTRAYEDTSAALEASDVFVIRFESLTGGADVAALFEYLELPVAPEVERMMAWIRSSAQERAARRATAPSRAFDDAEQEAIDRSGHLQIMAALHDRAAAAGRLL